MKRLEKKFEKYLARSPSKKHFRPQCWEYRKGDCTTPACSEFGKKCAVRHRQTEEQSSQKPKQKVTDIMLAKLNIHDNLVEHFRTTSRRSLQGVYGRAQVLRPNKRATIHKSHTESQLKVHRSLVAWEGTHQNSRTSEKCDAPAEKKT